MGFNSGFKGLIMEHGGSHIPHAADAPVDFSTQVDSCFTHMLLYLFFLSLDYLQILIVYD